MKYLLLAFAWLGLVVPKASQAQNITLINPILTGFYPDPSIVQVEKDYYLINSTFSYFPGLPVFHSKDLKNWKQIGNAIDRDSQMNFMDAPMTRGLFAPAISYSKGVFYITCTWIDRKGNFVITAKNPAGPWSDPVFLPEVRGIDPSLFFDGDKAYIIYNSDPPENKSLYPGHRTIRQYEFDPVALKAKGDETILVNGGVDITKKPVWIEGPHIMKKNDWYYLYAAEGGTSVNHSEVVFRSKSARGPFVAYSGNPILTQRDLPADRKNPITSAGHAQFVEGPDGETYAIFLAVRPYEGNYYNTGRETFIAPVQWKENWPIINPDSKEIKYYYSRKYPEIKHQDAAPKSGNFNYLETFKKPLDFSWLYLRSIDSSAITISKSSGLTLKLKPETCSELKSPAFVGKRQQHLNCSAETQLTFNTDKANEKVGITIFQNEDHYYFLCKSVDNGKPVIQLYQSQPKSKDLLLLGQKVLDTDSKTIYLRINAESRIYSFDYATVKGKWQKLKDDVDAKFLSSQVSDTFIGCVFGLYATANGQPSANEGMFRYFSYKGNDPMFN